MVEKPASVMLLTGPPGVGKSTVIKNVVTLLGDKAGGFYTREIRSQKRRIGFEIVTLDGRRAWLASRTTTPIFRDELSLGRYRVNLIAINSFAVPALQRALKAGQIVIVDEIGPMEIASALFCQTVEELLTSRAMVVGTIVQRSNHFANQVRAHPRVQVETVTIANREHLPLQIVEILNRLATG